MIIGLCGPQGVGKSTLAKELESGHGFVRINFKDKLVAICCDLFNLTPAHFEYPLKEVPLPDWGGLTPRQLAQRVGTDMARLIHPDVWVRAWERKVRAYQEDSARQRWHPTVGVVPFRVVADDLRFDNEVEAVHRLRGLVVRVHRLDHQPKADAHESEHALTTPPDRELIVPSMGWEHHGHWLRGVVESWEAASGS